MQTYLNLLDNITGELVRRFGAIHSDIAVAVNTTHPDSTMFMETTALKPIIIIINWLIFEIYIADRKATTCI